MIPPIFRAVDVPAVRALLKAPGKELRFYLFGRAPQGVQYPYAVWRSSGGTPENYLGQVPDIDNLGVQVDVYALQSQGPQVAQEVAEAIRDAIEPHCHITSWRGDSTDPGTNACVFSFDCDWWVGR